MTINIRPIEKKDNPLVAEIIRKSLESYGLDLPGTSYFDDSLDNLYDHYQNSAKSAYYVLELDEQIIGCGGFGQIKEGFPTAELQKLYLKSQYIQQGFGKRLFDKIRLESKRMGYQTLYIESSDKLSEALVFYERLGFKALDKPLDEIGPGHFTMNQWMVLDL